MMAPSSDLTGLFWVLFASAWGGGACAMAAWAWNTAEARATGPVGQAILAAIFGAFWPLVGVALLWGLRK